jgi:RHS repeat-associated protein
LLAEADAATGKTLRDYIWLPQDDASPAADNDNKGGASPPLPLALVTGASTTTPQLLMVHADHLGRPARLTDANRATVWQASYDPFGLRVSIIGPVEQNLRFPGQYFLIETGLSYNWHRLYDPATGRYTQPDPLRFVDGPGVYGYAIGNPVSQFDPSGLTASCPAHPPASSDPAWKPYVGPSWVFHCGYGTYLENRTPTPDDPIAECVYDENQMLVGSDHPYCGCRGTPNQYPASDPRHIWPDTGGIINNGLGAYLSSHLHDYDSYRDWWKFWQQ